MILGVLQEEIGGKVCDIEKDVETYLSFKYSYFVTIPCFRVSLLLDHQTPQALLRISKLVRVSYISFLSSFRSNLIRSISSRS